MSKKSGAARRRAQETRATDGGAAAHGNAPEASAGRAGRGAPVESLRGGAVQRRDAELFPLAEVRATIQWEAEAYYKAGLVGSKSLEQVVALILTGRDLGLPPSQALAGLYLEDGKIAMQADLMRALVLRSGVGLIEPVVVEAERCVVRAVRYGKAGRPDTTFEIEWTHAMAAKAGLLGKKSWQQYERQMHFARASSEAGRTLFSDVLAGVIYTPEELGGDAPAAEAPVQSTATPTPTPRSGGAKPLKSHPPLVPPAETASGVPFLAPESAPEPRPAGGKPVGQGTTLPAAPTGSPGDSQPPAAEKTPSATRHLTTTILLDLAGGGVKTVLTAGLSKVQYEMLLALTQPTGGYPGWEAAKAHGAAAVKRLGQPNVMHLTEAEGSELVAEMSVIASGEEQPPVNVPVTGHGADPQWQQARAQLDALCMASGINHTAGLCAAFKVDRLEDIAAADFARAVGQLRDVAAQTGDPATQLVMEQLRQQSELGG